MRKTATCYSANCIGWLSLCIFQIDHAGFVSIDDGSVAVLALLRDAMVIGEVDMPVGKQARMVLIEQGVEALKAPVRDGLEVVEMARGRMGEQHIKAAVQPETQPSLADAALHLILGEHVFSVAVLVGAAESEDAQAVHHYKLIICTDTAGGQALVLFVMIAVDIHQRTIRHGHEELEILYAQIAAGEDQIIAVELAGAVIIIERF